MEKQVVDRLLDWANSAEAFASSQLPDLVEQILTWGAVKSVFYLTVGVSLSVLAVGVIKTLKAADPYDDTATVKSVCAYLVAGWGIIMAIYGTSCLIMLAVAPKVYLLEYLKAFSR